MKNSYITSKWTEISLQRGGGGEEWGRELKKSTNSWTAITCVLGTMKMDLYAMECGRK